MSRSRSRWGSVDFGQKSHHSSIFSKKIYGSKFCRGDSVVAQIDATALKPLPISPEQQMREMEEENNRLREELKEAKEAAEMIANHSTAELETLKKTIAATTDEIKLKDKKIQSLELELGRARQQESEKDASLTKELRDLRQRENDNTQLISQTRKKIQELEAELHQKNISESKMADSFVAQSRQLDSAVFELEESKIEIASLQEKITSLEDLCNQMSRGGGINNNSNSNDDTIRSLKFELSRAKQGEMEAIEKAERLSEELEMLKHEWKFAIEGENQSANAMEDLAIALKEVAMEAHQAKEQLIQKEEEVNQLKQEMEKMTEAVNEAQQELDSHKQNADKLRSETEETLFAWNAKEISFMSCIKRAEEERALAQIENHKLAESLKAAENMTRAAREETYKLRDILKQAINESNAAKAAAGIARDENSLLKDCLAEKEEALHFITKENERLRISEAAAQEHVKQLKRMLTMASAEIKLNDKDEIGFVMFTDDEEGNLRKKMTREFSFELEDLKFMNEPEEFDDALDEDPEKAEALKGSIFDTSAETPKSEAKTPKATFFRLKPHASDGEGSGGGSEHDHHEHDEDHDHEHDQDHDKQQHRRSKTMFQRVGGLLTIRKSFIRKDPAPSSDHKLTPTQANSPHL